MKRKMTPKAKKIFEDARGWAKSPAGQKSIKRAVRMADLSIKRMREAQEPLDPWWV